MELLKYLNLALLILGFVWQVWAVQKFFRKDQGEKQPQRFALIKFLAPIAVLALAAFIGTSTTATLSFQLAATGCLIAYLVLYGWALRSVGKNRFFLAYSTSTPSEMMEGGPYRWTRHPFYTSYLLSYLGGALASESLYAIPIVVLMILVYTGAARFEEQRLRTATFGAAYENYQRRVGRFTPWF